MDVTTLGDHVSGAYTFKGSKQKPFLAPRGVAVMKGKLFVSDTGQNRVFIWNQLPTTEFQEPDVILGQLDVQDAERNSGGTVSASTLLYPSGLWSDGQKLIVADAWNHRVLIWHSIPETNGTPADVVLGQPDFESNKVNVKGISSAPSDKTLHWPYGVYSDGKQLWVADTGNRRILFFGTIPEDSFTSADGVIGQPDFTSKDYENDQPVWPYAVAVGKNGTIAVPDTQFYRILLWNTYKNAPSRRADVIIGQEHFDASGQNQFGLFPSATSLNWTYDVCFFKNGLLVCDTGNSRILYYKNLPKVNNAKADAVIGKRDFVTGSENKDTQLGTQSSLYWPFSIAAVEHQLIIADTGNHRLVIADLLL